MLETEPIVSQVQISGETLTVHLADGRSLSVPLAWFPRLVHATPEELYNWQVIGDGYAVEWPDLDEHIGVEGLLAGRRSGESERSFQRWLEGRRSREQTDPAVLDVREYRRRRGNDTWHFCTDCSFFPETDYETSAVSPAGEICNECRSKFET
ncbi:MAG TPA: DUF2442 domain-containing protein [Longimicrobiaceae bacterium]|nr:DUF2442 domain-containing protein [Longimicrobiaceae bacterium]